MIRRFFLGGGWFRILYTALKRGQSGEWHTIIIQKYVKSTFSKEQGSCGIPGKTRPTGITLIINDA